MSRQGDNMGLILPADYTFRSGLSDDGWIDKNASLLVRRISLGHPERAALEQFIANAFFSMYGARISHFCRTLIGCQNRDGEWIAALGLSLARDGATFLEQYIDGPLEDEIGARIQAPVAREAIVEVGNLASTHAGAARTLIIYMTRYLHSQGLEWVAFTATKGLLNSFARLRITPKVLAAADPARLPDAGKNWGSYYASAPQVMFASIGNGYAKLAG
jgi:hypothetical protein